MNPLPFSKTRASVLLDALRGIAALLVLVEHWRNALFVDFAQVTHSRTLVGALYLLCSAGHQAVIVFFVLSGYLVGGSVIRVVRSGKWSWGDYLNHRLVRLWIVLIPALLLTLAWDQTGMHLRPHSPVYMGLSSDHMTGNVAAQGAGTPLGNLVFLQTIFVPGLGSNGPLWSLASEWWYYILFPLAAGAFVVSKTKSGKLLNVCLFIGVCLLVGKAILSMFPIWLFGVLLYVMPAPKTRVSPWLTVPLYSVAVFSVAALSRRSVAPLLVSDLVLGIITFAFVWSLLNQREMADEKSCWVTGSRTLARFSYTLYLAHMPLLIFVESVVLKGQRVPPTGTFLAFGVVILICAVAYAFALASVTEFQTERVRAWLSQLWKRDERTIRRSADVQLPVIGS